MKHIAQVLDCALPILQPRPMKAGSMTNRHAFWLQADFFPAQMPAGVGRPKKQGGLMTTRGPACGDTAAAGRSAITPDGNHGENTR